MLDIAIENWDEAIEKMTMARDWNVNYIAEQLEINPLLDMSNFEETVAMQTSMIEEWLGYTDAQKIERFGNITV